MGSKQEHPAIENLREHQQQLDADGIMVGVSREALEEALALIDRLLGPSAESLLARLDLAAQEDGSRLIVMAQNPANNHHWSLAVGKFTAGEVRAALAQAKADPTRKVKTDE